MLRFLLCCCFPVFAALPVIGTKQGEEVLDSDAKAEGLLGYFSVIGDSERTPFVLQVSFGDCRELKDRYNKALPVSFKLKYKNTQNNLESLDLKLPAKGRNCFSNIEFYNNVQERYDMELWAFWEDKKASAGTFYGNASFKILPKH